MAFKKSKAAKSARFKVLDSKAKWSEFSMMLFGSPGSGKTYLAGTTVQVPEMSPVLLVDNDGGSRTVRGKPQFEGIRILRMFNSDFTDYRDFTYWLAGDFAKVGPEALKHFNSLGDPREFKTIIVDNVGAIHNGMVDEILETVNNNRPHPETPSMADYGLARSRMRKTFQNFTKISEARKVTFIFTCHVDLVKTEYETVAKMRPLIPGKLASEIPGDLPIVGYIEVAPSRKTLGQQKQKEGGERIIYFDPRVNSKLEVKDHSELLGATVMAPTMIKIYSSLKGVLDV